uniref:UDP-glucuronosyltransferase n=1 Tax=Gouania willdenowi TaxID=441366 RepID=A0A8C5DH15_GOUWI
MKSGVWYPVLGLLAWLCCSGLEPVGAGKVLVLPVDGSHWLSMKILVKELGQRGHEVVVLVPETSMLIQGSGNFKTEVYKVPYSNDELERNMNSLRESLFEKPPEITDMFINIERLVNFTSFQEKGCESLLNNEVLMSQLKETGFDVVLTDPFLPCGSVLAYMFSIPTVYFLRGLPCGLDLMANQCPTPPSYVPASFSGNTDTMDFKQRIKNMLMYSLETYMCKIIYVHFDNLVSKYLEKGMTYKDVLSHGAIWLLRYDFTFEWPKPIMPNMVLIGGINCATKAPLPADLQEFVDGAGDDGFIVFTLGSMVSNMPEDKAKKFFDAFRQLPQRVLWRYTGALPDDMPKNVRTMKWLPQNDLLAHPNAKVFMTHGGTHGIYEGICNGVPMLMLPLFGDQGENVHRMVSRGVAETIDLFSMTSDTLAAALKQIIHDKSYKEKMTELSLIHLDRPVQPLDLAAFWTEFVMRHKGASHLRVAAHDLNWFQYHSLDVIGFISVIVITVMFLTLKCCLFCTRKCCRKAAAKRKSD